MKHFSIFAVGSKDATVRLYTVNNYLNFRPYSLIGHADAVIGIFFEQNSLDLMTVSRYDTIDKLKILFVNVFLNLNGLCRNGHLTVWQCTLGLDQLISVQSTSKKRFKLNNDDDDDDDAEDDIDLSKGEERERYVANKEGI